MVEQEAPAAAPVSVVEAKAWLRVEHPEEDATIAGLVRSASELCEQFTRRALIVRTVRETVAADGEWRRLTLTPVRAITAVERVADDGTVSALPAGAADSDIDANGDGWVRSNGRVRVTYQAGLAADWNGLPEALRQGIARLAAHLYVTRDGAGGEPPAAVSALWRPWRRMRLG